MPPVSSIPSRAPAPIASIEARRLDVPMKKPFGISGGAQDFAANVLVELTTTNGIQGYGEGAPFPAFNGETQEVTLAACLRAIPRLGGIDVEDTDAIRRCLRETCADSPSARCAIETAIFDVRARLRGIPLHKMLGGAENRIVTDITITTGTVEQAADEARAFAAFDALKVKVAAGPVDADVARIHAVRAARPDAKILVDANGGWTVDQAIEFAAKVKDARLALFEQPVPPGDWAALAEVRRATGLLVAIDESVTSAGDVSEAKRRGAADVINVKIMKSGVFEALAIIERATQEGLLRMIGGMVETRLAMGTSACIAAGFGGFSFIDLDTPLFLVEDPFIGGYTQGEDDGAIDLSSIDRGHGLRPR